MSWIPLKEQVDVRDWVGHESLNATKYDLHSLASTCSFHPFSFGLTIIINA